MGGSPRGQETRDWGPSCGMGASSIFPGTDPGETEFHTLGNQRPLWRTWPSCLKLRLGHPPSAPSHLPLGPHPPPPSLLSSFPSASRLRGLGSAHGGCASQFCSEWCTPGGHSGQGEPEHGQGCEWWLSQCSAGGWPRGSVSMLGWALLLLPLGSAMPGRRQS